MGILRATRGLVLGGLVLASMLDSGSSGIAYASPPAGDVATDPAPRRDTDKDEPHRFSPVVQGVLGATAGSFLVAGGLLVASTGVDYDAAKVGSNGASCRPCSNGDLRNLQGREYGGYALIGLGGVLAITDIVIVALDVKSRSNPKRREGKSHARADVGAGVRF